MSTSEDWPPLTLKAVLCKYQRKRDTDSIKTVSLTDLECIPSVIRAAVMRACLHVPQQLFLIQGVDSCMHLRKHCLLETIDLVDNDSQGIVESLVSLCGVEAVAQAFCINASDAVAMAGSPAVHKLGLSLKALLTLCENSPLQAAAVIDQELLRFKMNEADSAIIPGVRHASPLASVDVRTLIRTGVDLRTCHHVSMQTMLADISTECASKEEIAKLGLPTFSLY